MKPWLKCFVLYLIAVIVSTLLAPILPLFATMREGKSGNGSTTAVEPRLPSWLRWFDNPDNSLWGDSGWQKEHCPRFYGCYLGMVLWLLRNKAGGFVWDVLGAKVNDSMITWEGTYPIGDGDGFTPGTLRCRCGDFWQWKYVSAWSVFGRGLSLNFGWLLDAFIDTPFYAPKARFLAQIQFPRVIK